MPNHARSISRDVRPILSDNCFACHGPDDKARKAGLRLDTKEGAFAKLKSGGLAIVPGKPDESELIFRIESDDPELHMPPKKSGKQLTADQVAVLRRWVEQGATWSTHWAFEPPRKPALPAVKNAGWPINEIDRFILARLEAEGLSPSPEAGKTTLIRRVTLDLTGLPPTLREVDAFLADSSQEAYEKVVDRLLDSPRYGEHMARFWLDAARYGDTHGLHLDNYREVWPYRDWVIRAFNANKPFDRFIVEQLAGDLLPDADARPDHRHRLQPLPRLDQRRGLDRRGGLRPQHRGPGRYQRDRLPGPDDRLRPLPRPQVRPDPDEGLLPALRVLQQHRRPRDGRQFRQVGADRRRCRPPSRRAALRAVDAQIAELQKTIAAEAARAAAAYDTKADAAGSEAARRADFVWIDDALPAGRQPAGRRPWDFVGKPDHPVYSGSLALRNTAQGLNQRFFDNAGRKLKVGDGDTLFAYVYIDPHNPPRELMLQWHTKGGWSHRAYWGENVIDWGKDGTPERLRMGDLPAVGQVGAAGSAGRQAQAQAPGTVIDGWAFTQHGGTVYWDKAGIADPDPAGRSALRLAHGLGPGPARRRRRGLAREPQGDRRARAIASGPRPRPRSSAPTSSSTPTPRPAGRFEPLRSKLERSRAERGSSSTSRSRRRWSFARRPASPSRRSCSSGASTTSGVRRWAGPCPRSCRRFRRARRSTAWDWPSG